MPNWSSFNAFLAQAEAADVVDRQALVDRLLESRSQFPWIDGNHVTFIYTSDEAQRVALSLDTIHRDPPFAEMQRLEGTNLFHITRRLESDDLMDYTFAVDDPMTPLATETDLLARAEQHWKSDPLNPTGLHTSLMPVSIVRMPKARPLPNWEHMPNVNIGKTKEHKLKLPESTFDKRKVWVYTPPNYKDSGLIYPVLILQDGVSAVNSMQVPHIVNALLKHGRIAPVVVAMVESAPATDRAEEYMSDDRYSDFVVGELVPFLQNTYRIDATRAAIGGWTAGAFAAADIALKYPDKFTALLMLSPLLNSELYNERTSALMARFAGENPLPKRIFQSVGRYDDERLFAKPGQSLAQMLSHRPETAHRFVQIGSGAGLIAFRSLLPEALSWILPGWANV